MPANVNETPFIIRPAADLLQRYPALKHAADRLAHKYAFKELVSDDDLKQMGGLLWQALDQATAFEQARQASGLALLPVIIESDEPAVQQLPWETLYHPEHGFLGQAPGFTLSRRASAPAAAPPPLEPGPLRVLLFTTLPDDLEAESARLDIEEEQARLQEALLPWLAEGLVALEMPHDGRFSTFQALLRQFQPHLLFLSGHGKFHYQPHTGQPGYTVFLFEDEAGRGHPVRDRDLIQAFAGARLQAVVLSACESGKAVSAALSQSLVQQLGQVGVPHVIGMRESILDRAGTLFAHHFCTAIAQRERIDVALQAARRAITTPLKDTPWLDAGAGPLSELSLGQWCLPLLLSADPGRPLIDWDFAPQPPQPGLTNQTLNTISLPPRFVGRRAELRELTTRLAQGDLKQLLITGPGGQGKTALAGKLAQELEQDGYTILAWSARPESSWDEFLFELELQLTPTNAERYDRMAARTAQERDKARLLLRLLLVQSRNRLILFFDNLESLQAPDSLALSDPSLQAWLEAGQSLLSQGLILLLTSRWRLPGWPEADHWPLAHPSYGDFLQMARMEALPPDFFRDHARLRRLYRTLHGNGRGQTFFAAAVQGLSLAEEAVFLDKLAQAEAETQTDMALARIVEQLSPAEQSLLARLPAFPSPVPIDGLIKLGLDLAPAPEDLLQRLLAVSLLEQQYDHDWHSYQYQCPPLVVAWLQRRGVPAPSQPLL